MAKWAGGGGRHISHTTLFLAHSYRNCLSTATTDWSLLFFFTKTGTFSLNEMEIPDDHIRDKCPFFLEIPGSFLVTVHH